MDIQSLPWDQVLKEAQESLLDGSSVFTAREYYQKKFGKEPSKEEMRSLIEVYRQYRLQRNSKQEPNSSQENSPEG